MISCVERDDCNWWYPKDGRNFWMEWTNKKDLYRSIELFWKKESFLYFIVGDIYVSSISFFVFKTPDLAFENATKHEDLTVWMGDEDNDESMRETVSAHLSQPNSFLSGYVRSNSPFMILGERIVFDHDAHKKIHLFHILNEEKPGWIYAPNEEVTKIKKWKL